ncbi:MAG: hypothetical protein P0Y53_03775 [Candidatus Pseudobacter hemicellulosilyticus]|uniref:Uncharacterized protein n=1 Tax=Candidatus Pseudobacter hemicellulosilyticus TaxID=3121375 RepID=A0AAJ5WTT4_9BACT|nr:MAG: hypothetical protein P0Y53_03775 [Pseudobacter sp.]
MYRKTFIRSFAGIVVVAGVVLILAAARRHQSVAPAASSTELKEECQKMKSQAEFLIWETLERAVLTNVLYR